MPARNTISPLDWKNPIVDPNTGAPSLQFIRQWEAAFQNEGGTHTTAVEAAAVAGEAVPQSRLINTTAPILGGGDLTDDRTLSHATSGVTPGAYTNANITVDADGHVTLAANGSGIAPNVQAVTSSATVTPTFSNDLVKITAQAVALALANPTGTAVDGWGLVIRIKDNGTARAISYGTQYRAIGVTLPTTTVISKTLYLALIYNAADTRWDVVAVAQEA